MSVGAIEIAGRPVGPGEPTFVVAELSGNHGGSLERAKELVRAAAEAGADAVKIQTYRPETLTIDCDRTWFRVGGGTIWDGRTLWDLYGEAQTPWEWHEPLAAAASDAGLTFFSTPFDATSADELEDRGVPVFKIASFELVDTEFVRYMGSKGRPVILSTGMATAAEIDEAVSAVRAAGAPLALLHCNSSYPARYDEFDLRTIPHMAEAWSVPVGLSDHSLGDATAIAAVALGASIVEKHLTLSRAEPGPDSAFSMEPAEFATMVDGIRAVEAALGRVRYGPSPGEGASLLFRRSLFVVEDVAEGERLTDRNVRAIRPGHGLPPRYAAAVLGRRAKKRIEKGTPLSLDLLD